MDRKRAATSFISNSVGMNKRYSYLSQQQRAPARVTAKQQLQRLISSAPTRATSEHKTSATARVFPSSEMVLLDDVYLSMNRNRCYASVTPRLMEDTALEIELHIRYCNPVFIGLLSSRMPISLSCLVMNVKELVILVDVNKCL